MGMVYNPNTASWLQTVGALYDAIDEITDKIYACSSDVPVLEAAVPVIPIEKLKPFRIPEIEAAHMPIFLELESGYFPINTETLISMGDVAVRSQFQDVTSELAVLFQFE
jgi:hypothetical protein